MPKYTLKAALIITLGGCMLLLIPFFYNFYIPNRKMLERSINETTEVQQNIRVKSNQIEKLREEITSLDSYQTHLNYFHRLNLPEPERIPYLLKSLAGEASALGIKFISIDPRPPEKNDFFIKHIFMVEVRAATYPTMLHFLDGIENTLHLNIDELSIQQDEDKPDQLWAKIAINTLEMGDRPFRTFHKVDQIRSLNMGNTRQARLKEGDPQWSDEGARKLVMARAVARNPFASSRIPRLSSKREREEILPVKKGDEEIILRAIMDFQGERIAILGRDRIKQGEILKDMHVGDRYIDMKVLAIDKGSVMLGDGQKKYVFKLPENPIFPYFKK
jgi:Tfp pilus assembly protein PilO